MSCHVCTDSTCQLCLASSLAARENTEVTATGAIACNGPAAVARFRLITLRGMLSLEAKGMKSRKGSTLKCVRAEFGIRARTAATALPVYESMLRERGIIR